MARAPRKPEEIFSDFADDWQKLYGQDLISVVLYGSGAIGDYRPGKSDLNFLVVLTEEGIRALERCFKLVTKWSRRRVATPLIMTREYIATSMDAFPLEFLNMKRHYQVVWGEDPLSEIVVDGEKLRLQCEREVKGKLLQLRETYLSSGGRKREVKVIIAQSLTAFLAIFEGILYLRDRDIPSQRGAVISQIAEEVGLDQVLFLRLLQVKEGKTKLTASEMQTIIGRYIEEIRRLAFWLDSLVH